MYGTYAIIGTWMIIISAGRLSAAPIPAQHLTSSLLLETLEHPSQTKNYVGIDGPTFLHRTPHHVPDVSQPGHKIPQSVSSAGTPPSPRNVQPAWNLEIKIYEKQIEAWVAMGYQIEALNGYFGAIQMRKKQLVHDQYPWNLVLDYISFQDEVDEICRSEEYSSPNEYNQTFIPHLAQRLLLQIDQDRESLVDSLAWRIKQQRLRRLPKYSDKDYNASVRYVAFWRSQEIALCKKGLKRSEKTEEWVERAQQAVKNGKDFVNQFLGSTEVKMSIGVKEDIEELNRDIELLKASINAKKLVAAREAENRGLRGGVQRGSNHRHG
ncbi:hypothetical protein H0H93_000814 [Arthromyces matolae]|nr:hypothetical protein H0H93_000814 [Arthromyces matolae]